jgi:hypothetical protein
MSRGHTGGRDVYVDKMAPKTVSLGFLGVEILALATLLL